MANGRSLTVLRSARDFRPNGSIGRCPNGRIDSSTIIARIRNRDNL